MDSPNIRFYAGCPVKAPDGTNLGTLCIIDHEPRDLASDDADLLRDLAGMVENEFRAVQLATLDDLTRLTNRRGFNAIAYHTLALCERVEKPAALLMFDLDDFKEINDTMGHAEGDRTLRRYRVRSQRASQRGGAPGGCRPADVQRQEAETEHGPDLTAGCPGRRKRPDAEPRPPRFRTGCVE